MKTYQLKNGKELIIRTATLEDAADMLKYLDQVGGESDFLTFGPGESMMTLENEEGFIKSMSNSDNKLLIVAVIDGRLVGNLGFTGGGRPRVRHVGEFGVSVLKEYWGLGIARNLMKYLIQWSKDSGTVRKINLRVRADNAAGIHLYKTLGFVEEGIRSREFYMEGSFYDCLMMGLEID